MFDKIEVSIPRTTAWRPKLHRLAPSAEATNRASQSRTFRSYDLRASGCPAFWRRTFLPDRPDTLVYWRAAELNAEQLLSIPESLFDLDAPTLRISRLDCAVDIPDVPVSWFWQRAVASGKRTMSLFGKVSHHSGLLKETFAFGTARDRFSIYDKVAEQAHLYRCECRRAKAEQSFEQWSGLSRKSVLTRVERQMRGVAVPEDCRTLAGLLGQGPVANPFKRFRLLDGALIVRPGNDSALRQRNRAIYQMLIELYGGDRAAKNTRQNGQKRP